MGTIARSQCKKSRHRVLPWMRLMLGEKLDGRTTMIEIVTENPEQLNLLANKERIWYVV